MKERIEKKMKEQRIKTNKMLCESINAELNVYPTVTGVYIQNDERFPEGLYMGVARMRASRNSVHNYAWLTIQNVMDESCVYRVEIDVEEIEVWKDPNKGLIQNINTGLIITYTKVNKQSDQNLKTENDYAFELASPA